MISACLPLSRKNSPIAASGVGRQMYWSGAGIGGAGGDDRRVLHRAELAQLVDDLRNRGLLLSDRHVDAVHVRLALVDDRVERDRGLAGLAVADDQLALARGRSESSRRSHLMPVWSGSHTPWRSNDARAP